MRVVLFELHANHRESCKIFLRGQVRPPLAPAAESLVRHRHCHYQVACPSRWRCPSRRRRRCRWRWRCRWLRTCAAREPMTRTVSVPVSVPVSVSVPLSVSVSVPVPVPVPLRLTVIFSLTATLLMGMSVAGILLHCNVNGRDNDITATIALLLSGNVPVVVLLSGNCGVALLPVGAVFYYLADTLLLYVMTVLLLL